MFMQPLSREPSNEGEAGARGLRWTEKSLAATEEANLSAATAPRILRVLIAIATIVGLISVTSAAATTDFRGDFESGSFRPWAGVQLETDRPASDSFEMVYRSRAAGTLRREVRRAAGVQPLRMGRVNAGAVEFR